MAILANKNKLLSMTKRINTINIVRMPKAAHVIFIGDILDAALKNERICSVCADCVAALQNAHCAEEDVLVVSTKSFHTDTIVAADRERGVLYMALKKAIQNFLRVPLPEFSRPAKILNQKIKDMGIRPKMQLDAETGLLFAFTEDLIENYSAEVEALSLTKLLHALKAANDRVSASTNSRYEERMTRRPAALQKARRVSDVGEDRQCPRPD